ncbi:Non-specific serine/threonine protein kinase protein, partial [Dioscorea alata]
MSMISKDPLGALSTWRNKSLHHCQWTGVSCSNSHQPQRVTSLILDSLMLAGTLSPSLANLTFLQTIILSNNYFSGTIPPELGRLLRLQTLVLSNNSLAGDIPTNITSCLSLQNLSLDTNMLTGEIPAELGKLVNLVRLRLYTDNLTGSIPASVGNLTSLLSLDLSENSLQGDIPDTIGKLVKLAFIQLSINRLSGKLSSSLCNFSSAYYIDVGLNQLYGEVPRNMGSNLPSVRRLYLYSNQFKGSIPVWLSNASRLERLGLEENQFNGVVPPELGMLPNLSWLALGNNHLGAQTTSDWEFLNALTNCSNLQILEFSDNLFNSMLPSSIANLSTQLQWLSMENNQITGSIPEEMGRYINLTVLLMHDNLLTGSIPASIGRLQSLHRLSLSENRFSGEIPSSLGNLTQLNELNLGGNGFEGNIPGSLGNLQNLNFLNLSCNKLKGSIPKEVVSLSSLSKFLDVSYNFLIGPLPLEVGSLKNLVGFNLSENQLSGEIPSTLGQCLLLEYLLLEGNSFEGTIPSSLSNLKGLQQLDLSHNNLSGQIPEFLENFQFLNYLNLSFNDFEGDVPKGGTFRNLTAASLIGNSKLCRSNQSCSFEAAEGRHITTTVIMIIVVISIFLALFLLSLFGFSYYRKKSRTSLIMADMMDYHSNVSYAELARATDGFSTSNLIGAGSFGTVYKGIMERDEKIVAVKVLNLQSRGAEKSFLAECEALRNIRHRNLVKILTTCASLDPQGNDFKALVFEFMPNESLEKWLHPQTSDGYNFMKLSFIQMLNIAIDVASALDYLHHQVQTPIVHCDVKPSNILLDIDMVAHVTDFGLARLLSRTASGSSTMSSTSIGLRGSIGYVPPEYGMDERVSTNGDVYSYGILLLEMFTGKRPTDETFNDGLNLHKFVELAFPDRVIEIISQDLIVEDAGIKDGEDDSTTSYARTRLQMCLIKIIWIALSCSRESPKYRNNMGNVVRELLETRDLFLEG